MNRFFPKYYLIILSIFFTVSAFSQSTFQKAYGGVNDDEIKRLIHTKDNGYLLVGNSNSFANSIEMSIVKVDSVGVFQWAKTYANTGNTKGFDCYQADDGSLYITGREEQGNQDILLMKTDSAGNILFIKKYGGGGEEYGKELMVHLNRIYVMSYTSSVGAGINDQMISAYDMNGNFIWAKSYGGNKNDFPFGIQITADSNLLICGYRRDYISKFTATLLKLDTLGNIIWGSEYTATNDIVFSDIQTTPDNGQIIVGWVYLTGKDREVAIIKTDSAGNIQWAQAYGGNVREIPINIVKAKDGGFIVFGTSNSFGGGDNDILMFKVNATGSLEWARKYGGIGNEYVTSHTNQIIINPDNSINFAYESDSNGIGKRDLIFVKADSLGQTINCNYSTVNLGVQGLNLGRTIWSPSISAVNWASNFSSNANARIMDSKVLCCLDEFRKKLDTVICWNDTVPLSAETGLSYQWTPSAMISSDTCQSVLAFPGMDADIVVTIIGQDSCIKTDTFRFAVISKNSSFLKDTAICKGDSVQIIGPTGLIYDWNPNHFINNGSIQNPIASPDSTSPLYLGFTDPNGCMKFDSLIITVNELQGEMISTDSILCLKDTLQLMASGGVAYQWYPGSSLSSSIIANPLAFPVHNTVYYVEILDSLNCTAIDSVNIIVIAVEITPSDDTTICFGDTIQVIGEGGINHLWSPNLYISNVNIYNPLVFPDSTITYLVTVTDSFRCQESDTVKIFVNKVTASTSSDTILCLGDTIQIKANGGSGFLWSPNLSISSTLIQNPLIYPITDITYHVQVSDSLNCNSMDSIIISVISGEGILVSQDTTICYPDSVQLISQGAISYHWTPALGLTDPFSSKPIAFPRQGTVYYLSTTDSFNCSHKDSILINVNEVLLDVKRDTVVCEGERINLIASGGKIYLWEPQLLFQDPTQSSQNIEIFNDEIISVHVIDSNNCSASDTVYIQVHPLPMVDAGSDTTIILGNSIILNAMGLGSLLWVPGNSLDCDTCRNPKAMPVETTLYILRLIDSNGCISYDSVNILVDNKCAELKLPNAFTPNGDGKNDQLNILMTEGVASLDMFSIYNRWGERIFTTNDFYTGWDGSHNGEDQAAGSYTFLIKYSCVNQQGILVSGNVMLFR